MGIDYECFQHKVECVLYFLLDYERHIVIVAAIFLLILWGTVYFCKNKSSGGNSVVIKMSNKSLSGIVFGKKCRYGGYVTSPEKQEGHLICLGPSGTGKTSALLIPTLNNWADTSFVVDISGDIYKNTTMDNKVVYEPESPETIPFNIFHGIDILPTVDDKNIALENMAYALVPELSPQETSAGAKYYNEGARDIILASFIAFYHQGLDFVEICEKIMNSDYQALFSEIDNSGNDVAIRYINSFAGGISEHISGCKGDANKAVKIFAQNSFVKKSLRRPKEGEFCVSVQTTETHNVFLKVSDSKLDVYSPLVRLITVLLLNYFSARTIDSNNILFCLDELASFGRLDLIGSLRKLRKNRVRLFCLTQSLADLKMIYGSDQTEAMMNNFAYKIILGATDTPTQEYFAKLIGYQKVTRTSIQQGGKNRRTTKSEAKEYAVEPESLARLKDELILLYPDGHLRLKKNYYFK